MPPSTADLYVGPAPTLLAAGGNTPLDSRCINLYLVSWLGLKGFTPCSFAVCGDDDESNVSFAQPPADIKDDDGVGGWLYTTQVYIELRLQLILIQMVW